MQPTQGQASEVRGHLVREAGLRLQTTLLPLTEGQSKHLTQDLEGLWS